MNVKNFFCLHSLIKQLFYEKGVKHMSGSQIKKDREMYVVKSNDLIKARYNLTTQQQKIILYAISKIQPNDKPGKWYEISISDLCKACGLIIDDTGYYYKSIKDDLRKLTNRLWMKIPGEIEATVSFLDDAEIIPLSGKVHIKFHKRLEKHLFELKGQYTQYKLESVLAFENKYAIRLFELFKSEVRKKDMDTWNETELKYTVEELRDLLKVEKYSKWPEFNRNVIKKAIDDINKYSEDFRVKYDTYKKGKRVDTIVFIINYPSEREIFITHEANREKLSAGRKKINRKPPTIKELEKRIETNAAKINNDFEMVKNYIASFENKEEIPKEQREIILRTLMIIKAFQEHGANLQETEINEQLQNLIKVNS